MAFTKVTSTLADTLNQNTTGSAATLTTARTIGGTSFDGSANIAVALAATATALATARTIGGTSFDGTANITPGLAATATALATARTIGGTSFDGTADIAVATATEATNITAVANNSADETVYPTFVDGATGTQGLETDTGFTYNPSSGDLTTAGQLGGATLSLSGNATVGGNLTVTGTSTVVNTVTMNAQNAIVFEGATADNYETTLSIVDPTADHTQYLINQGGYIPVLAASTTTAISATPAELNLLDGSTANSVVNSKAVVYGSSGELAGTLSTAAQTNITSLGTLTTLTVDDITINSSTISDGGDLTLDVAGDIILDADGGDIRFKDGGTEIGVFENSSSDLQIKASVQDKDIIFRGNDGGSGINALVLDMSDAGKATFNNGIVSNAGVVVDDITIDGSTISASSSLTLDLGGNLTINVDGTVVSLSDDTVNFGQFFNTGAGAFNIYSPTSNQDMVFRGNDGGSGIIALTLDMSNSGNAIFNYGVETKGYVSLTTASNKSVQIESATSNKSFLSAWQDVAMFGINRDPASGSIAQSGKAAATIKLASNDADSNMVFQTTATNNAEPTTRMTIDKNGDVLIGQSSQTGYTFAEKLVVGDGDANDGITIQSGTTHQGNLAFNKGDGTTAYGRILYQQDTNYMAFFTNNAEKMRIMTDGKVGIGTTAPGALLDIGGGLIADPVLLIDSAAGGDPQLRFDTSAVNRGAQILFYDQGTNSGGIKYHHNGNRMDFCAGSASTVSMSIKDNQTVGIATQTPQGNLDVNGTSYFQNTVHMQGAAKLQFIGGVYHTFQESGNNLLLRRDDTATTLVTFSDTGSTTINSDSRFKENIATITGATAKLKQLRGVTHTWTPELQSDDPAQVSLGVIAQEVETVIPEVVYTAPITEEDPHGYKSVDYAKLVPLLIETIKELEARIATLEG